MLFNLFESEKQEIIVVESQPLESFIFPEKFSYFFAFFDETKLGLADNCRGFSVVAVDAHRLRRQSYDDPVVIVGKDSDRLPEVCLDNPVAK